MSDFWQPYISLTNNKLAKGTQFKIEQIIETKSLNSFMNEFKSLPDVKLVYAWYDLFHCVLRVDIHYHNKVSTKHEFHHNDYILYHNDEITTYTRDSMLEHFKPI